jgi:hypothetical protein
MGIAVSERNILPAYGNQEGLQEYHGKSQERSFLHV